MNYFKAKYFGAKTNYTWTLPPDEVPDISLDLDGVTYVKRDEKQKKRLEKLKREDQEIVIILKNFVRCLN